MIGIPVIGSIAGAVIVTANTVTSSLIILPKIDFQSLCILPIDHEAQKYYAIFRTDSLISLRGHTGVSGETVIHRSRGNPRHIRGYSHPPLSQRIRAIERKSEADRKMNKDHEL